MRKKLLRQFALIGLLKIIFTGFSMLLLMKIKAEFVNVMLQKILLSCAILPSIYFLKRTLLMLALTLNVNVLVGMIVISLRFFVFKMLLPWVIDNDQIWKSKVVKNKEEKTDFKYELKEGPLWTPKYVGLVVQLIDKLGNKYLLKARDKEVFYTY